MNQEIASRFVLDADTTVAYAADDSPGYVACAALDERNLAPTFPGTEKRWGLVGSASGAPADVANLGGSFSVVAQGLGTAANGWSVQAT